MSRHGGTHGRYQVRSFSRDSCRPNTTGMYTEMHASGIAGVLPTPWPADGPQVKVMHSNEQRIEYTSIKPGLHHPGTPCSPSSRPGSN